jgi:spectinomycin phosphotransferase
MLTRPEITDDRVIACLCDDFGLRIAKVTFLPIGADVNSAAFRVTADDGTPDFLKLRRGHFTEIAVAVPTFLHAQGIGAIMAPIATPTNQLWVHSGDFNWILYPYFEGRRGLEAALSKTRWIRLGESMKAVHTTVLPARLAWQMPREDYAPRCRRIVRAFHQQVCRSAYADPIAARLAAFWTMKSDEIECIVERADQLAQALQKRAVDLVVCHGDLHGGNVLVSANEELAVVDWDEPILAPKERDLMFVGGGVGGVWNQAQEAVWFYEGYGHAEVDPVALAYYRYERIVVDIAAYGERILGRRGSAEDREEGLRRFMNQFLPGNVAEIAHRSYPYPI